jgi:hypothetical protein
VHERVLDAGGEVVDGEVDDNSFWFELYFALPAGTESKKTNKERKQ